MSMDYGDINEQSNFDTVLQSVKKLLDDIIRKPSGFKFFVHPLGFYYCRIINSTENQLRLHFWRFDYEIKDDLFIHDHFYELSSWVLNGMILDFTYSVRPGKNGSAYALFKSFYEDGNDVRTIKRTDEFQDVELVESSEIKSGQQYFIKKGTFHSNRVMVDPGSVALTCVYTFDHNRETVPRVIGLYEQEEFTESVPLQLTEIEITELCTLVLKKLEL